MKRLLVALALAAPAAALAEPPPTPLDTRLREVCAGFQPGAKDFDKIFAPEFLAQVPPAQLTKITESVIDKVGRCTEARLAKRNGETSAELEIVTEKGWRIPGTLVIGADPPNLVSTFLIRPPIKDARSFDDIAAELKKLRGTVSALVLPLSPGSKPLLSLDDERPLAVGSAFKLFVLAELGRQGRKLDQVTTLRPELASLPSGFLHTWPAGAPVTLHTLATLMISVSDNTATDHLIDLLGREALEVGLQHSGHRHPAGMRPFLTTAEMFKLKLLADEATRARYAKAGDAEQRQILASLTRPLSEAHPETFIKPTYIDSIEWYASVGDLCRVMDLLRKQKPLREALAVSLPLTTGDKAWTFSGFKGGSEPGVLNLTLVLEGARGAYCVAATWNDASRNLEEAAFAGLVQAMIRELEKREVR